MVGESEAGQLLAKILNHIIALELSMDQHIDPQLFLPGNGLSNGPFNDAFILLRSGLSLCWLLSISVLKRAHMLALPVLFRCYLLIREMT
jgi:hypothetical protein